LIEGEREEAWSLRYACEPEYSGEASQADGRDIVEKKGIIIDGIGLPISLIDSRGVLGQRDVVHPLINRGHPPEPEKSSRDHDEEEQEEKMAGLDGAQELFHSARNYSERARSFQ
jgi:hypothetical protein